MSDPSGDENPNSPVGSADLVRRASARLVDGVLLGVAIALLLLAFNVPTTSVLWIVAFPLGTLTYFVVLEAATGSTPGKRVFRLNVMSTSGRTVSLGQAFARNWWYVFSLASEIGLLLMLGVSIYIAMTISSSERNQGFHDRMAQTLVMRS